MKLALLLYGLKIKLKFSTLFNPTFKKALQQQEFSILIRTQNFKHSRYFKFSMGKVSSNFWTTSGADTELIWKDANTAFSVLTGSEARILEALGKKQLTLKGDVQNFFKFGEIVDASA